MPTYEYACDSCGHRFEAFQGMNDKPLSCCPECGETVRRVLGAGGAVIFKGSGFHTTDYRRGSGSPTRCGRDTTCCGRGEPCDKPPCDN